jgi:hypothetical protein
MLRIVTLLLAITFSGCSPARQPEGPAAAVEISLRTTADDADLVAMLRQQAPLQGFHVDDVSAKWRDFEQHVKDFPPAIQKTIYVGVWRGKDDDDLIVSVDDGGHPRKAWITFYRGPEPKFAEQFWDTLTGEIRRRWPDVHSIPILPSGGLPLSNDLILTPQGYKIVRSAAERYKLPVSSALLANN